MKRCPRCATALEHDLSACPACGLSVGDVSAETEVLPADPQSDTPTRLETDSKKSNTPITTTGGSGRFVAGTVLAGRYRVVGLIGKGGMGEVYKAEDLELEQTVALKFLPEELAKNEELLRRFRGEVRNARQVSHANVCRVFDIGETEGLYYLTMEYIDGDDLSMLLKRIGRFPSDRAVEVSRQICMGLAAIHKAGILHRDLKPANIIIDSKGEARITDFGIAGLEDQVQGLESRIGTPAYMSPEQADGKELTKQSDIYSLGLLLYEIFTGKQAYEGDSVQELRVKHATTTPKDPSDIVAGIDPIVEKVINRCLEKDPHNRPDSALRVAMSLPGGDPLQVALEAGETPTPEMVAAAPMEGALSRGLGLVLTVVFIGLSVGMLYVQSIYLETVTAPLTKPPEVLEERAREIAARLGYKDPPADFTSGFDRDHSIQEYADKQPDREAFWAKFRTGQPAFFRFDYRQSPKPLIPMDEDGEVTAQDPPMLEPGMIRMELDTTGRLMRFTAVPIAPETLPGPKSETDWAIAFEMAGLNIADFVLADPEGIPVYFADEIVAWQGPLTGNPDIQTTVLGNALRGRVTAFEIRAPWSASTLPTVEREEAGQNSVRDIVGLTIFVIVVIVLLAALALVRHNLKKGRGDVKGALKLFAFTFVTFTFGVVILTHKVGMPTEDMPRFVSIVAMNLLVPLTLLVLYLAIEPVARKRFPELLVSWNRLLAGRFTDPLIGRDVLIGLSVGVAMAWFVEMLKALLAKAGFGQLEPFHWAQINNLDALHGVDVVMIVRLFDLVGFLAFSIFLLFWFLFLSLLLKRRYWAVAVTVLIVSAPGIGAAFAGHYIDLLEVGILSAVTMLCLVRFGLVTTWMIAFAIPRTDLYTFDSGKYFATTTLFIIGFQAALAIGAFLIATKGQPWFKRDLLE
ncbi:MAG: protein kinase [Pyrinomonadaceae bacterium]